MTAYKLVADLLALAPADRHDKRLASRAISKIDGELALDQVRGFVANQVRQDADGPLKAAFLALVSEFDTLKQAMAALAEMTKEDVLATHLNVPRLKQYLRDYYKPEARVLRDAGIRNEDFALFGGGFAPGADE